MADRLDISVAFTVVDDAYPDYPLSDALHFYSLDDYTSKTEADITALKQERLANYLAVVSMDYRAANGIPEPILPDAPVDGGA